jgi:hypothetical protein
MKKIVIIVLLSFVGLLFFGGLIFVSQLISFSNNEIELKNAFKQKKDERTAFYDKMWKTISQKTKIAVKNDESFKQNINIIMTGRQDSENVIFKLIQEVNPNANFGEVSSLYKDLSRTIEGEREGFFNQEKVMQDIVMQHSNLLDKFPNSFYNIFFNRKHLEYKPITSDRTDEVMKSGKDNNVDLELK